MAIMHKEESDTLINTVTSLVSSNNAWESVLKFFNNDKIGKGYLEKARREVFDNNQEYSIMIITALEDMSERIQDAIDDEDNMDNNKLRNEIYKLESENTKLKKKLYNIKNAMYE
jgi:hypothetical protein